MHIATIVGLGLLMAAALPIMVSGISRVRYGATTLNQNNLMGTYLSDAELKNLKPAGAVVLSGVFRIIISLALLAIAAEIWNLTLLAITLCILIYMIFVAGLLTVAYISEKARLYSS